MRPGPNVIKLFSVSFTKLSAFLLTILAKVTPIVA
jgi:hypothetical protein